MKIIGGLLCFVSFACGVMGLIFGGMTIYALLLYAGKEMGHEAAGFTGAFVGLAFVLLFISGVSGYFGWKLLKTIE